MASTDAEAASLPAPSNQEDDAHTPTPLSPPRSKTPPTITGKRAHSRAQSATASAAAIHRSGSAPVNPTALNRALKQMEDAGRRRDITPAGSPQRKRQKTFAGDHRFIPTDQDRTSRRVTVCWTTKARLQLPRARIRSLRRRSCTFKRGMRTGLILRCCGRRCSTMRCLRV